MPWRVTNHIMRFSFSFFLAVAVLTANSARRADVVAVTDNTTYNVGDQVNIRLHPGTNATASIRYAGESSPAIADVPISGTDYKALWKVPWEARTGRYAAGRKQRSRCNVLCCSSSACEAVSVELDKTFYTSGDPVKFAHRSAQLLESPA
jgi:hypothetical protein